MKTIAKSNFKKQILTRIWMALLVPAVFALAVTNALATLQCYEPYNYTLGVTPGAATGTPTQTSGGGFTGPYNGGGAQTTVAGLSYSGLLTGANALQIQGGYIGENVVSPISSGTVYVSFLINLPQNPTVTLSGLEMNTGGNGMFMGITAAGDGTQGYLGVNQQAGYNDGVANEWQSAAPLTYGNTYFVVVKLTGDGSSGWTGSIWVNPTAGTATEPTPDGTFTVPQFTISACSIVNPGGGNMLFDELRLADSWADAVSYTAPTALSVSITSPANGATVGPDFTISANALASPQTVSSVTFYDNDNNVGSISSSPYTVSVTGASVGAHALKAIAEDSDGNFATSSVVNVTVGAVSVTLFPNGDFDHPAGPAAGNDGSGDYWATNSFGAPFSFSFPTSGGNSGGYAVMDDTGGGSYGVLVGGNVTPVPLSSLGLIAGQTYTFQQDMKILSGSSIGGFKIESWGPSGKISDNGGVYPDLIGDGSTWETYTFSYTIDPAATGLKIVPLWGPNSSVGYDNIGVQVPATALSVSITSPTNDATVNTNFIITASALVSPATVTNVYFYVDDALVGNDSAYPYAYTSGDASLNGSHTLQVVAKASDGSSATSSVVNVTVVPAPQVIPDYPITDAPTPTRQSSAVISLFNSSGVYANQPVTTWATSWSAPSGLGVNYTNTVTGKVIKAYSTLQYAGVDFGPLDLSGYTTMHVDVWSPNATQFAIKMGDDVVPFTAGTTATTFNKKGWVSLDIPLSHFPSQPMSSLGEFLFVDNTPLMENATFYIDNVYFWTTNQTQASIAIGNRIGWTANGDDYYQPQKSSDGTTWVDLGGLLAGNAVTNAFDPSPVSFYQVQDIVPAQAVVNGGFESGSPVPDNWVAAQGSPVASTGTAHSGNSSINLDLESPSGAAVVQQGFNPVAGGATYNFSVWSSKAYDGYEFTTFCLVQWFDSTSAYLGQAQINLTPVTGDWTENTAILTAPANATQMQIQIVANTGGDAGAAGDLFVDDVSLTTIAAGATTNTISATVQSAAGITWKSVPGNNYTVQSTPGLAPAVWSPLGANVTGNNSGTNTVSDSLNNNGMFYRVLENY